MSLPSSEIIYTIIGTISLFLYIFLIVSLIYFRHRNSEIDFRSSFYSIFISVGIADCIQRIFNEYSTNLPFDSSLQYFYLNVSNGNDHVLPKIGTFTEYFCGYAQYFGHLLVSINRFTAMSYPLKHEKVASNV